MSSTKLADLLSRLRNYLDDCYFDVVTPPSGYWVQSAIKNPGAYRATAQSAGAITKNNTISLAWARGMYRAAKAGKPSFGGAGTPWSKTILDSTTKKRIYLYSTLYKMRTGKPLV